MPYTKFLQTIRYLSAAMIAIVIASGFAASANARCNAAELENFLRNRAFTLSADRKIGLYAREIVRYYNQRDRSRRQVLRAMRNWEERWPDRIYKFMRITDFAETADRDACRVTFDYKFIAYDPVRDKTSAGIGRTTLILAETGRDDALKIIAEYGKVRCRGLTKFARGRC